MRGISKKMFISILTSVIVMVTMVATTFAWVGIFTYANTENFNLNLKVQDLDVNYYLTISATGKIGSFSEEADLYDIQRQILKNQKKWPDSQIDSLSNLAVEAAYKNNCITTPSTTSIENNKLTEFKSIDMSTTDRFTYYTSDVPYLKFDIYLSVDTKEGIKRNELGEIPSDIKINSNVFLTQLENALEGTISDYVLFNKNQFKALPSANAILTTLPDHGTFKVNSKNATRFALCLYNPINIDGSYSENDEPINTYIYQGGTQNPSMDGEVYNLGGNLPEDSNTALKELLVIRPNYKDNNNVTYKEVYDNAYNESLLRANTDLELIEENSKIWEKPISPEYKQDTNGNYNYNFLGISNGVQTKMKISVYFWFEGWDADCLLAIDQKPVAMNLTFTAGIED